MSRTSTRALTTAILSSLIGFIFMALVLGKSQKYFTSKQKELGNLNGNIEEVYSGLNIIKTYNAKEEVNKKFDLYNKNVYEANRKSQFLAGLMQPMMGFIGNLGYVCVDSIYRGNGIGKTMTEYAIKYAKENGAYRIELTSRNDRESAHKLYLNLGFIKRDSSIFRKEFL